MQIKIVLTFLRMIIHDNDLQFKIINFYLKYWTNTFLSSLKFHFQKLYIPNIFHILNILSLLKEGGGGVSGGVSWLHCNILNHLSFQPYLLLALSIYLSIYLSLLSILLSLSIYILYIVSSCLWPTFTYKKDSIF